MIPTPRTDTLARRALVVTELFVAAKSGDQDDCEDVVRDGPDLAVVADGATDTFGTRIGGLTAGRAVAELVADVVTDAPTGIPALELVDRINAEYGSRLGATVRELPAGALPTAVFCAVDKPGRRVIRVGDTSWRTPARTHLGGKRIDRINAQARAALLHSLLAEGTPREELLEHDPGRQMILPVLRRQAAVRNRPRGSALTHAGIDGRPVPRHLVEEWSLADDEPVVLASDGYPRLFMELARCEAYLAADLARDPLRIGRHATTKAARPGHVSFDDRAFLRLDPAGG